MPIRFGVNLNSENKLRVSGYMGYMCIIGYFYFELLFRLIDCQRSIAQFKMPNMTSFTKEIFRNILYDDCRCSVLQTETCVTDIQLKAVRIMILTIFVSQVYLVWEYLWLSGNRIYIFAYAYWITSILSFLAISVVIHRSSLYHDMISCVLLFTGMSLLLGTVITITLMLNNGQL